MTRQSAIPERGQMQAKNAPPKPVTQDRMTSPPCQPTDRLMKPETLTIQIATYTVEHLMTVTKADGIQWCTTHHGTHYHHELEPCCDLCPPTHDLDDSPCTLTDLYHQTPAP